MDFPKLGLNGDIAEDTAMGRCQLLEILFRSCISAFDSYFIGEAFFTWLSQSGIDVEGCVSKQLECVPGGIVCCGR
ncbi:hypothetical protein EJ02DRAFT_3619 [Clathrospora elynae]|uniref:Uncharacterized protein n=1 Tax=Clathrospora elynae TaxID=706981 RepID=A0A6A5T434_9PLEO|nr:hypothetical protein EJ02DRAFT_3619 [Clathrospora elynae]